MKYKEKDDNFQTIREQFKDRTPEELDLEFEYLKKELNVKEKRELQDWFKKMRECDLAAEKAGGYVSLEKCDDIHYNYRAIDKYCKEKNIKPTELTEEELKLFVV